MKKYHHLHVVLSLIIVFSMLIYLVPSTVSAAGGTAPQTGTGTASDPYIIDEPLELVWMGDNFATIKSSYFVQTADIDMSSVVNFTPIGNGTGTDYSGDLFSGVFNGLGYKITNLTISSDLSYVGLFQRLSGTIKNVNLVGANITNTCSGYNYPYTGGISGQMYTSSVIKNCSVSGTISQTGAAFGPQTGGITGQNYGAISDCYCSATVTASSVNGQAGGIVGYTPADYVSVNNCVFFGSVGGTVTTIGAIVGNYFRGAITNNVFLIGSAPFGRGSINDNTGCTPADISAIKTKDTYTALSWDFDNTWKMDATTGYPTFITTPGIPGNVTAVSGNNQITVQWDAVEYASGYSVYYGTSAGIYGTPVTTSGTSAVISGLTNMTQYYIAVKALRVSTEGLASTELTCLPHIMISDLTAAGSLSSVDISFTAPTGASTVELQQSTDSGASYTAVSGVSLTSSSTGTILTGLAAGTYFYRLRLVFAGTESFSNTSSATVGGSYTTNASDSVSSLDYSWDYHYLGCYENVIDDVALKFDLSDCGGTVKTAYLYIYVSEYPDWSYGNAVFNLYGHSDISWTDTMPAYPIVPDNSTLIQTGVTGYVAGEYKKMLVTDYVESQLASGDKIITFFLAGQLTADMALDDVCISSAANPDHKPYIEIEFDNTNANLSGIKIGGTDLSGFSSGTTSYNYTAPHDSDVSALEFTSTLEDSSAIQSAWSYNTTNHTWSVTVTAPDGITTKTYTVSAAAALQSSDASLTSISINSNPITGFSSSTLNYNYTVAHDTDASVFTMTSAANDHMAVQGGWLYNSVSKKWSNTVTSEDGTTQTTYTVTINELPDIDATLKSIKVNGTDITGFSSSTLAYTFNVVHGTVITSASFLSVTTDVNATQGTWTYNAGTGKWSVLVTAEDGTTQETYTVTIHELPDTDATLKSIQIDGIGLSGFSSSTFAYTYDVVHGFDGSTLSLSSETTDDNASQGVWSYDSGTFTWSVLVTAEDDTTQETYTVTVNELPDTDATLKRIRIGTTDISGFASSTFAYTYDVVHGFDGSTLSLSSETTDDNASQGDWSYDAGTFTWSVLVTAEDDTTQEVYTVTINELPDTDATLKFITVNGNYIVDFLPLTLDYTVDVAHGSVIKTVSFVSATTDDNANQGTWTYSAVTGKWSVLVTAEDGTTQKTYTITINELPDTDATLSSIQIDTIEISGFSSSTFDYEYGVVHGSNGSLLNFTSETTDENAEQGTWTYDAVNDMWSILVTAEDGTTQKTYTVTINELPDTDATLKSIQVNGTDIVSFSPATMDYTVDAVHGTAFTSLSFVSETTDVNAIQGTWTYSAITGKWSVLVTAEDGTTQKTYTVTVNELPDTDATLSSIQIDTIDISGFVSSTFTYTYDVVHGSNGSLLMFTSATTDVNADQGTWTYDAVNDSWSVLVTAEDGTTQETYTVTINVLPDTDATLKSIKVNGTDVDSFSPTTQDYTVVVAHGTVITSASFESVTTDVNAVQEDWTYHAGKGVWLVRVTAEDGTTENYYSVEINELPDTDATLKSIKIGGTDISGFSSSTFSYTVDVAHGTVLTSVSFASVTTDVNALQGTWTYNAGTGKWSVLVTAEDGTTQNTYTITINELPNTDATLKSIKIGGTNMSGFSSLTLNYTYTAPKGSDLAALVFTSACSDVNATQSAWTYDSLNHKWSVTVTAQDTTVKKTYSVTVVEDLGKGDYKTNTLLYQGHVQDVGWMDAVMNGNIAGTTAQSKRMEAIRIKLQDIAGGIEYCTHIQDIGWTGWSADGDMSGTTAQSKRLEAIQIRLTGEAADKYDIYYRVHVQDIGWMDWAKNGQSAGTAACSYRMESIQIVMVLKGDPAPGPTDKAFYNGHTDKYNEQ